MIDQELKQRKKRIDNLLELGTQFSEDTELLSHWSRYLCILISGFLEISIKKIYSEYTKRHSYQLGVSNYVSSKLDRSRNPTVENICELANSFYPKWHAELDQLFSTKSDVKDAVTSIVSNRNKIAHGESVSLSFRALGEYYPRVVELIEFVERQALNNPQ